MADLYETRNCGNGAITAATRQAIARLVPILPRLGSRFIPQPHLSMHSATAASLSADPVPCTDYILKKKRLRPVDG